MQGYRKYKAFTLIELLVVISIIALLLSILVPSLAKVKRQTETVICTTRFKDIGNALGMYVIDYDGNLPASYLTSPAEAQQYAAGKIDTIWMARLSKYYDKSNIATTAGAFDQVYEMLAFRCPTQEYYLKLIKENPIRSKVTSPKTGNQITVFRSGGTFGYNMFFTGSQAYKGQFDPSQAGAGETTGNNNYNYRRMEAIKSTSNLPMVADSAAEPSYGYKGSPYLNPKDVSPDNIGGWMLMPMNPHPMAYNYGWEGGWWHYGPAPLHDGRINYLFADGHAEARKMWPWDDVENYDGPWDRKQYFHPEGQGLE